MKKIVDFIFFPETKRQIVLFSELMKIKTAKIQEKISIVQEKRTWCKKLKISVDKEGTWTVVLAELRKEAGRT